MTVGARLKITEKFELSDGTTVLACNNSDKKFNIIGKKFDLVLGDIVRQTLVISGERKMLNQGESIKQRAFETKEIVELSSEEARSGDWYLIEK